MEWNAGRLYAGGYDLNAKLRLGYGLMAQVAAAFKQAYDVGALIRGAVQLLLVGAGVLWAWNELDNLASTNKERIAALEAISRSHTEQLAQLPTLDLTARMLQQAMKELTASYQQTPATLATLTERIEGLRSQVGRLEVLVTQQNSTRTPGGR